MCKPSRYSHTYCVRVEINSCTLSSPYLHRNRFFSFLLFFNFSPLSFPIYLPPSPPLCLSFPSLSLLYLFTSCSSICPSCSLSSIPHNFSPDLIRTPSPPTPSHPTPHSRISFFFSFSISALLTIHLHTHTTPPPPTHSLSFCSHCSVSNGSAPSQQIHQAEARRAAAPANASQPLALSGLTAS